MNVVFLAPDYPPEMRQYTRGLVEVGARVFGVGDRPASHLHPSVRPLLTDYLQVPSLMDEEDVVARVSAWMRGRSVDRVLANWEVLVLTAAHLRDRWGVPGMTRETVLDFRDKQRMKERVLAAGLRTPHAARVSSALEARVAAERIGYPVVLKPIAGAGSADTFRVNSAAEMERILPAMRHVPEASCEEFIAGEEYTFDTLCVAGTPVFMHIAQYLPPPIIARSESWVSPVIISVRDRDQPKLQPGIRLGRGVLDALHMGDGFTHMEWFRTPAGEAVFGEIGCRPGGAHLVDQMNYQCDIDLFREWARVVCHGRFEAPTARKYNVAIIFKRALGEGRIQRIEGLRRFLHTWGDHVVEEKLLRPGTPRRNWKRTLTSDGHLIVRHPDWETTRRIAEDAAANVQLFAG